MLAARGRAAWAPGRRGTRRPGRRARSEPLSLWPASTCSSLIPRRPGRPASAARSTLPSRRAGNAICGAAACRAPARGRVGSARRRPAPCPGASRMRAVGRRLEPRVDDHAQRLPRRVGTAARRAAGRRRSTVPTPVSTAPARLRQAWPSARAASPVIHWLAPLSSAVRPSSEAATFMRTQGRPRTMREKKPMLSSREPRRPAGPTSTCDAGGAQARDALAGDQRVRVLDARRRRGPRRRRSARRSTAACGRGGRRVRA